MARWFRLHNSHIDHPKVVALNDHEYRFWLRLLCLAARLDRNGVLGTAQTIARLCPQRGRRVQLFLEKLHARGLVVTNLGTWAVHDWEQWQYTSDQSNQRVKAHRERYSNGQRNGSVTPPDYRKKDRLQRQTVTTAPNQHAGSLPPAPNGVGRSPAQMESDMQSGEKIAYTNGVIQTFVKEDSEAWRAWLAHKGVKSMPTNRDGGWFFETEYPIGYVPKPRSTATKNADTLKQISQNEIKPTSGLAIEEEIPF